MNTTLKDKITNICAVVIVLSGAVLALQTQGIILPDWMLTIAGISAAIATALIGYFTGKKE